VVVGSLEGDDAYKDDAHVAHQEDLEVVKLDDHYRANNFASLEENHHPYANSYKNEEDDLAGNSGGRKQNPLYPMMEHVEGKDQYDHVCNHHHGHDRPDQGLQVDHNSLRPYYQCDENYRFHDNVHLRKIDF
jgi:hypothetical protein